MAASEGVAPPSGTADGVPPSPRGRRGPVVDRQSSRREAVTAPRWDARGIVRVDHDVLVGRASVDGTVVVGGSLTAERLDARGSLEVHGPLEVRGEFRLRGALQAYGPVHVRDATLEGTVRVAGELAADSVLKMTGSLRAPSVRAGLLQLRGTATVAGTLTAHSVEAELVGDSVLGEVRAREVRLAAPVPNPLRWVLGKETTVTVGRIEAGSVELVAVRAAFVRSPAITLGPSAHLLACEGQIVRAHPSSRVGHESWSRPPAGLRR